MPRLYAVGPVLVHAVLSVACSKPPGGVASESGPAVSSRAHELSDAAAGGDVVRERRVLVWPGKPLPEPVVKLRATPAASAKPGYGFLTVSCDPPCEDVRVPGERVTGRIVHLELEAREVVVELFHGTIKDTVVVQVPERQAVACHVSWLPSAAVHDERAAYKAMRERLDQKVRSGKATLDELKVLRAVCRYQHDARCVKDITRLIEGRTGRDARPYP